VQRSRRHPLALTAVVIRRADDVQMELVMLDPYIRATLQHDSQVGNGCYPV
jgi:hypothetical protein